MDSKEKYERTKRNEYERRVQGDLLNMKNAKNTNKHLKYRLSRFKNQIEVKDEV